MKPVLFLVIHGIQLDHVPEGYAADFIDGIRKHLPDDCPVTIRSINWGKHVEARQRSVFEQLKKTHYWWTHWIIKLISTLLCDTWWYLLTLLGKDNGWLSKKIEDEVYYEIEVFKKSNPEGLIVLGGHSWGSQISLRLAYAQEFKLEGIITWGNVTYYLSGGYEDWGRAPKINFWHIYHNRADPISTPMVENPNFKDIVRVKEVSSWLRLTPLRAHCYYWQSAIMQKDIAETLFSVSFLDLK